MRRFGRVVAGLLAGATPIAAAAQDTPPRAAQAPQDAAPDDAGDEDIVVTGELRGAVEGNIQPELQLSPADVRAYGVSNVAELIAELAPQTRSGRGRDGGGPVVLLNGRRISNFAEIRDLPTEAIERVDILPEEVALKYGYRADQRVVNIVLRPRFRAITGELEAGMPTRGGNSRVEGDLDVLRINRNGRINVDIEYNATSALLESERDVVPTGSSALFDTRGNITAPGGSGEIDPALSALAGAPVTIAGVPASAAASPPGLGDFAASRRNASDLGAYRTLVAPSEQLAINAVLSRALSDKVSASFNARIEANQREPLLGLPGVTLILPAGNPASPFAGDVALHRYVEGVSPLTRESSSLAGHLGFSVNGDALPWRWSVTGNYDQSRSESVTTTGLDPAPIQALLDANAALNAYAPLPPGLLIPRAPDLSESTSRVGSLDALVNGPLAELPGGDVSAAIRLGARTSDFESSSLRSGLAQSGNVARDSGSAQLNLDVPIASRRRGVLSAIGDFTLNGNVEVERLSDFGTLVTTGYGAVWSPVKQVRLIASVTDEEGAPSAQQLGDPVTTTPNVRVFDYVRGETAFVTSTSGGNPGLGADSRNVLKLGLNARPLDSTELNLSADYVRTTTRNQIASFPSPSAEIEAAFPGRFVRDAGGRLVGVDTRPVNFARAEREELRWGFNFSMPLSSTLEKRVTAYREQVETARREGRPIPPPPEGLRGRGGQGAGQPGQRGAGGEGGQGPRRFGAGGPGGGPGGQGGRGFGRFGGPNGALAGRIHFSLYHTLHLREQIVIRDGLPVLDLLDGSATGSRGGQPRHEVEAQLGVSKDGFGLRLNGRWQSGTQVESGVVGSGERLDFSSLGTLGLRAFADLGQQLGRKHRWARGMRVSLGVENLFDARLRVTDSAGAVPLSYQPDLLDPTGRSVRLSIRKLFF